VNGNEYVTLCDFVGDIARALENRRRSSQFNSLFAMYSNSLECFLIPELAFAREKILQQ
jgi:hypothetical protein